jgi:alpha-N-arabinofuranosidase
MTFELEMKLFLIIALLILFCKIPQSFSEEATIKINTNEVASTQISKNIFGGFVEFLLDYINGENGMCAQELKDRGMDLNYRHISSADDWEVYSTGKGTKAELLKGGYNLNGQNYQKLSSSSFISKIGVYQNVYINDTVDYDFYMYAKSYEKNNITINLIDSSFITSYFTAKVMSDSLNWKKYSVKIPKLKNAPKRLNLLISIDSVSSVDIDEVSLMQSDNVFGVRKEYSDLIEKWKPGIIRYPGGTFADDYSSLFQSYIGEIDQRTSPNLSYPFNLNQRLDFGLHEYLLFCEKLEIEAQITVNTKFESEKEAWNWIEYCIGDSNSLNGKIRTQMGHPKPFVLNYVEIGNENWDNLDVYLPRYLKFYDYIKERNSDIKLIVNLNHWDKTITPKVLSYIKDKVDLVSFHPTVFVPNNVNATNNQIFESTVGSAQAMDNNIKSLSQDLYNLGYGKRVKQGISEWWSSYGDMNDWLIDTNRRNSSLESALWNISNVNAFLRHPEEVSLANRTNGIGMIKRGFDLNNNRVIYGSSSLWGISLLSNHHGDSLVKTELNCEYFDAHDIKELWGVYGASRLDVTSTKSKDSLFISIVNRYPNDSLIVSIEIDNSKYFGNAKIYYLNSDNYTDCNTANEPLKVISKELNTYIKGTYFLPPHSFNIIAIANTKNKIDTLKNERQFYVDNYINSVLNLSLVKYPVENTFLRIYNLLGLEVYNTKLYLDKINYTFWLAGLPSGVYYGRINEINFKFIKIVN